MEQYVFQKKKIME